MPSLEACLVQNNATEEERSMFLRLTRDVGTSTKALASHLSTLQAEEAQLRDQLTAQGVAVRTPLQQTAMQFNVSPEQLQLELDEAGGDITQTAAFKAWFKDSEIVNADGTPRIVYHGTKQTGITGFKSIDLQFAPIGQPRPDGLIFFTYDPGFAATWAEGRPPTEEGKAVGEEFRAREKEIFDEELAKVGGDVNQSDGVLERTRDRMIEETGSRSSFAAASETNVNVLPVYLSVQKLFIPSRDAGLIEELLNSMETMQGIVEAGSHTDGNYLVYENPTVVAKMKELGFDGVLLTETVSVEPHTIAVFEPTQIKSVFNDGSFSQTDPNILHQGRAPKDVAWTSERVTSVIETYEHSYEGKTKARVAWVNPQDFVHSTVGSPETLQQIKHEVAERGGLREDKLAAESQTPFLHIDGKTIVGHEGRHRLQALADAGYTRVPVVLVTREYASLEDNPLLVMEGQVFEDGPHLSGAQGPDLVVHDVIDLTSANRDRILARMSPDQATLLFQSPIQGGDNPNRISTRIPTGKKGTEDVVGGNLSVGTDDMKSLPAKKGRVPFKINMDFIRNYVGFKTNKRNPDKVAEEFLQHVVSNLLWLHDQVDPEITARSQQWYDGANAVSNRLAEEHGIPVSAVAAVMAALSPQKDWFQNASLGERMIDIHMRFSYGNMKGVTTDAAHRETINRIFAGAKKAKARARVLNASYSELTEPADKAMWLRSYDETHNPREYRVLSPEGNWIGDPQGTAAWGSLSEISKGINALLDPSQENLTYIMGMRHKVRNFYNNILAPNAPHGDVTIDTHAVAAAMLRPLAGGSTEVMHALGTGPMKGKAPADWPGGAASSGALGVIGTYGIYADAYRMAAEQRGILPRQMQSITWEAVRGLYPAGFKQSAKNKADIDNIWKQHDIGKITIEEARAQILVRADGINKPDWVNDGNTVDEGRGLGSYDGELVGLRISDRAPRGAAGLGGAVGNNRPPRRRTLSPRQAKRLIRSRLGPKLSQSVLTPAQLTNPRLALTSSTAFKKYWKDSKVKDLNGFKMSVWHGTTHDIEEFKRGNINAENDQGVGFYFTSTRGDALENYAGVGPDLRNRLDRLTEQLVNEIENDPEAFGFPTPAMGQWEGMRDGDVEAKADEIARSRLMGPGANVMEVWVSLQNPVIMSHPEQDKNTWLEAEVAESGEGEGGFFELMGALTDVLAELTETNPNNFPSDLTYAMSIIHEAALDNGGIYADELHRSWKKLAYVESAETGDILNSEVLRRAFEELGFDGVMDYGIKDKFQGMRAVTMDTVHVVAFEPTQIKSVNNEGTFDPANPLVLKQDGEEAGRGSFQRETEIYGDVSQLANVIRLNGSKDRTTFLHETGHFWLYHLYDLQARDDLTTQGRATIEKMIASTKGWFEANSKQAMADLKQMTKAARAEAEASPSVERERYAQSMEAAVAHAELDGQGGVAYMRDVANNFMNGEMAHGTHLEVGFHELWARGAEKYLGSGSAPSAELKGAFSRFASWVTTAYKTLDRLNVTLSPEISDVFDRLVATEEALDLERQRSAFIIPPSLSELLTEKERKALQQFAQEAKQQATAQMQTKVADDLKREQTEEYKAKEAEVRERVTAEVRQQPLYAALNYAVRGTQPNGNEVVDENGKPSRMQLDRKEVAAVWDSATANKLPRGMMAPKGVEGHGVYGLAVVAGFKHHDDMIKALIAPHLSEAEAINEAVAAEMAQDKESLLDPHSLDEAVAEVLSNSKQVELMAAQLRILRRLARGTVAAATQREALKEGAPQKPADDREVLEDAQRGQGAEDAEDAIPGSFRVLAAEEQQKANRPQRAAQRHAAERLAQLSRAVDLNTIKKAAARFVASQPVGKLSPQKFRQTADRLGKRLEKAIAKRDYALAAQLMQQKMLNTVIARDAAAANDKVTKAVKRLNKTLNKPNGTLAKTHNIDIVDALRFGLEPYEIVRERRNPPNFDPADALADLKEADPASFEDLLAIVTTIRSQAVAMMEKNPEAPYKAMPFEDFEALINTADNMLANARADRSIETAEGKQATVDLANEVIGRTTDLVPEDSKKGESGAGTERERFFMGLRGSARAAIVRIELWAKMVDQNDFNGPLTRALVRPIQLALDEYHQRRRIPLQRLLDVLAPVRGSLSKSVRIEAKELDGWVFRTKGEIIAAMLHTGNPSNLRKLLLGGQKNVRGQQRQTVWATENPDTKELDTSNWDAFVARMFQEGILTNKDMEMVQEIWDIFEETKAQAQVAHKKMFGHFFKVIEAEAVVVNGVSYRGGYVPAIANPLMSDKGAANLEEDLLNTQQTATMFPGAEKGFTVARTQVTLPLQLNLTMLPSHYDRVMKFAYLGPAVRNAARMINSKEMRHAIGRFDSAMINKAIIPWLQRVVTQRITQPTQHPQWDRVFSFINSSTGLQAMTGNMANAAQQMTGVVTAAVMVRPDQLMRAMFQWNKDGVQVREYIRLRSPFMARRMYDSVRDITVQIEDILTDRTPLKKAQAFAKKYGYFAQQQTQNMVDVTVWLAAEDQGRRNGLYARVYSAHLHLGEETAARKADAAVYLYADSIVRDTQTPMSPEDVSRIEATNAFGRLFVKFYSYFNNMYNLNRSQFKVAAREIGWKGKPGRMFYLYLMGIAVPAILAKAITMGARGSFDVDDEDEIPMVLAELFLISQLELVAGFVPAGGALLARLHGQITPQQYDDRLTFSPVLSFVESAMGGALRIAEALTDDAEVDSARMLKDVLNMIGISFGLPTNWAAKPGAYLLKVDEGEADPENVWDYVQGALSGRDGTED